jgi:hypothetical protein
MFAEKIHAEKFVTSSSVLKKFQNFHPLRLQPKKNSAGKQKMATSPPSASKK